MILEVSKVPRKLYKNKNEYELTKIKAHFRIFEPFLKSIFAIRCYA